MSGEAKPEGHNGDIWPRALTKHGAILAAKIVLFLLKVSIKYKSSEKTCQAKLKTLLGLLLSNIPSSVFAGKTSNNFYINAPLIFL